MVPWLARRGLLESLLQFLLFLHLRDGDCSEQPRFVSHYWGTPFCHFVGTVRKHAETLSDPSPVSWMLASYWVCSFANNQWRVEEEAAWQSS